MTATDLTEIAAMAITAHNEALRAQEAAQAEPEPGQPEG